MPMGQRAGFGALFQVCFQLVCEWCLRIGLSPGAGDVSRTVVVVSRVST